MRRRKARWGQTVALTLTGIVVSLACGCGNGGTSRPDDQDGDPLVFIRADSTVVEFPATVETYVWCGNWSADEVTIPALHVLVRTPYAQQTYWWLRAVISDIELEAPMTFPIYFVWDQPDSAHIFLYDPPNELATDTEGSSGTITFHRIPCPAGELVDFSIDAILGSEYGDMPAVAARGRFTAQVAGAPPGFEELRVAAGRIVRRASDARPANEEQESPR